jgi:hypothetical protein
MLRDGMPSTFSVCSVGMDLKEICIAFIFIMLFPGLGLGR